MSFAIRNPPRPPRLSRVSTQPPTCSPHRAAPPRVPRARYASEPSLADLLEAPPGYVRSAPPTAPKTDADQGASLADLLRPPPGYRVPPTAADSAASLTDLLRPPPGYVSTGDVAKKEEPMRPLNQPYIGARSRDRMRHDTLLHRLKVHAEKGEVSEAERLLDDMKHAPFKPSREAYEALITAYLRVGGLIKAEAMFRSLKEAGERPSAFIYSSLIGACVSRLREEENVARAVIYYKEMEMLNMKPLNVAAHTLMRAILLRTSPYVGLGVKLLRLMVSRKAPLPPEAVWQAFITWRLASPADPEEQRSLWEILAMMQQLDIAIRTTVATALLDSRLHLSAPLLLHMLKHATDHTRTRVIDRLASEDWALAARTYESHATQATQDRTQDRVRPYGLISFAPSAGELQRAVALLEREAPLTDEDFAASFVAALRPGQHRAPPPLATAEQLYALWKRRATTVPTPCLVRALQALLPVSQMQPLALQMWSDVLAADQPLAPAVLEPLFAAIDAGAAHWVGVIFDVLLRANRITPALMTEYVRLTPHKTSRVKEIVNGLDRSVPLSAATLNVLARAAAEELDAATAQELIQQTKYLSFVVEGETWDAVAFMFARMERPFEALRVLQAVQDRSPFGSPDVPSQRTSNALLVALVNQARYPDAAKFYKRMRCQFEVTALTTILPLLANADINFALQILTDVAAGRVQALIPLPLVLRRLCVRMLKSAEEARNPSAKAPIILWMQKNGVPLTKPDESSE